MTPQQFQESAPRLLAWISATLDGAEASARPVADFGFPRLPDYFSIRLLAEARAVPVERVPLPPLSSLGLGEFAGFERMQVSGITYMDTFFVQRGEAANESLFFHELVHVLQWRALGPEKFLAAYAAGLERFGYRENPLEVMAYELEERFASKAETFDVEQIVGRQMKWRLKETGAES